MTTPQLRHIARYKSLYFIKFLVIKLNRPMLSLAFEDTILIEKIRKKSDVILILGLPYGVGHLE